VEEGRTHLRKYGLLMTFSGWPNSFTIWPNSIVVIPVGAGCLSSELPSVLLGLRN
jgi:hypothetical protein